MMNDHYIQCSLKWSLKPPESIWAFQFWGEHQVSFYNVLVLHKLYELCVNHGHDFSKTTSTYPRNSSRFSTKISIWTCWDVGVEIPSDFRSSGLSNYLSKVVQIATKRLSVRWRLWTQSIALSVAWQTSHLVLVFAPKGTSRRKRQSSLSYLHCKLNGKRVSDQTSKCWNTLGRFQ